MKKLMKRAAVIAIAAALAIGLAGCVLDDKEERTGALEVVVDAGSLSKDFLPPIEMICESYDILVTDSSLNVIVDENITGNVTYDGLLPDLYTVELVGLNDTGFAIGGGSNTADVVVGQVTPCPVTVAEYTGLGTLQVTASWTSGVIAAPVIESELTYSGGSPADISADWTEGTDSATLDKGSLAQGWYALVMRLFDTGSTVPSAGFATLARIVKDQITSGTVALVPNAATGGFEVLIDLDFYDPLVLGTDVPAGELVVRDLSPVQTITVSGADVCAWYVNGVAVGSTAGFDVDPADYVMGNTYRVDCIGWSADGEHAGMLTWDFTVDPFDPYMVIVKFLGTGFIGKNYKLLLGNPPLFGVVKADNYMEVGNLPANIYGPTVIIDVNGDGQYIAVAPDVWEVWPDVISIPLTAPVVCDFGIIGQ